MEIRLLKGMPRLAALVLVTILSTLGTKAFAQVEVGNLRYTFANGKATVNGFAITATDRTTATIPETVTYDGTTYDVTAIGKKAFYSNSNLTSVTIQGNKLTNIGSDAFNGCTALTSINIPKSVTSIGSQAFASCNSENFTKVIIEDIAAWCKIDFGGNTANPLYYAGHLYLSTDTEITKLVIPDGVESISDFAFYWCRGLTSVTIPSSVKTIGNHAFNSCSNLAAVTMNEGVTSIGTNAFSGCNITALVIPNSVTTIGNNVFKECASLESVTIGSGVTEIVYGAFMGCTSLESVIIPDNVTSVGKSVFEGCTSLKSVTIGSGVTSIGAGAFKSCTGLTTITSKAQTPPTIVGETVEYTYATFAGVTVGNVTLKVPAGTKEAYSSDDSGWKDFNIEEQPITTESDDVTIYYQYTDESKTALKVVKGEISNESGAITIPATVSVGGSAVPVTTIDEYAFQSKTGLTSVTIQGDKLTTIGAYAFKGCSILNSIEIPNSVTSIGAEAFYKCPYLTSVAIGDNVTTIGNHAFYECTNLSTLTLGSGVTEIGESAFGYCSALTTLSIPNSVTSIGESAFIGCKELNGTVTIPSGVTSISKNVFNSCESLTSVIFK